MYIDVKIDELSPWRRLRSPCTADCHWSSFAGYLLPARCIQCVRYLRPARYLLSARYLLPAGYLLPARYLAIYTACCPGYLDSDSWPPQFLDKRQLSPVSSHGDPRPQARWAEAAAARCRTHTDTPHKPLIGTRYALITTTWYLVIVTINSLILIDNILIGVSSV